MQEYIVARGMADGSKEYARGEKRSLNQGDAKPLLEMGAIVEAPAPKAKPASARETKAAK